MKVRERVLILCFGFILLISGFGLVYRLAADKATWNPSDIYNEVGGSYYSSVSSSSSSSDGVAVSMRSSMRSSRRRVKMPVFSNARSAEGLSAIAVANSQSPIANSQGLYTTSSHMAKSFGSGFATGTAAPSFVTRNSEQPTASVLSVPSLVDFTTSNPSLLTVNTQSSSASAAASTPMGLQGRRRIGIQDNYLGWLDNKWNGGKEGLTYEDLRKLYIEMTGDTDFANEEAWKAFWEWFQNSQSDSFAWKLLPLHDATWFVLLLCMIYAVLVYRKSTATKASAK
jgi:hypothetical protein